MMTHQNSKIEHSTSITTVQANLLSIFFRSQQRDLEFPSFIEESTPAGVKNKI